MNKDPLKRATVDELLNDPFVNGIPPQKIEPMQCLYSCYKLISPTMLKLCICKVLAINMSSVAKNAAQKLFEQMNSNVNNTKKDIINKRDIMQYILMCGFDIEYAQNIAHNMLCWFGERSDENNELVMSINGFKILWFYSGLQTHPGYRYKVFEVFDDDADGFLSVDDIEAVFMSYDIIYMDIDEIKWLRTSMYKDNNYLRGKIHRMLLEISPDQQDYQNPVVSLDQFVLAMDK